MITLSGGPLGGQEMDATGWAEGEERTVEGCIYRKINGQAVFCGMAD